jgi:hypothetical protein
MQNLPLATVRRDRGIARMHQMQNLPRSQVPTSIGSFRMTGPPGRW